MAASNNPDYLAPFKQRRQRNLAYFQKFHKHIYDSVKNLELTTVDLVVKPSRHDVDLVVDGESLYQGRARAQARSEVKTFCAQRDSGAKINASVAPFNPKANEDSAFARKSMAAIARQSLLTAGEFEGYSADGSFPMLVFMGCGLGYHIELLLDKRDTDLAIVFEPNTEVFAASLYTVDWKKICTHVRDNEGTIVFHIATDSNDDSAEDALQHDLTESIPLYPYGTQYFVHRGNTAMHKLRNQLNKEFGTNLAGRGGYDNFVGRFKNAVCFYDKKIPAIPAKGSVESNRPIVIAGSGPSIDNRMDDIRAVREHILLVSAGTGLDSLLASGIKPDIHLEIDPQYLVYRRHSLNTEEIKGIRFLGAPDVYPVLWDIFDEGRYYNPHGSPIAPLFGSDIHQIHGTAPTCTNAAIAVMSQMGYRQLFLFGTDYGFRKHDQHHSSSMLSYVGNDTVLKEKYENYGKKKFAIDVTFEVESTDGQTCYTNPAFNLAKSSAEKLIAETNEKSTRVHFYNCSDGARIEGTQWLSADDFIRTVQDLPADDADLDKLFSHKARPAPPSDVKTKVDRLYEVLRLHMDNIQKLVAANTPKSKRDMTHLSLQLIAYFNTFQKSSKGNNPDIRLLATRLTRDEMINFLTLGFTHTLALDEEQDVRDFLGTWSAGLTQFVEELPDNFRQQTDKSKALDRWNFD